jgi:hypothetical protein
MPNACPFLIFGLGPTRIYVATLRATLLQSEHHLPDARESSTIPTLVAMLQVYPFCRLRSRRKMEAEDLDRPKPKATKGEQTDHYKWLVFCVDC